MAGSHIPLRDETLCPDGMHSFAVFLRITHQKHIGAFGTIELLDHHYIIAEHFGNLVVSDVRRQPKRLWRRQSRGDKPLVSHNLVVAQHHGLGGIHNVYTLCLEMPRQCEIIATHNHTVRLQNTYSRQHCHRSVGRIP